MSAELLSDKRLKWAALVANGERPYIAYGKAFGSQSVDACRKGAQRLSKNVALQKEIQRLRHEAERMAGGAVLTLAEKRRFLAEIVRMPVGKLTPMSPLVQEVKRAKPLSSADQPALFSDEEVAQTEWETVRMPDKLKALELDAKLAGELAEDKARTVAAEAGDAMVQVMREIAMRKS